MIENGSIEAVTDDGENYGALIVPIYPFDPSANIAAQVKSRTGIQLGAKSPVAADPPIKGLLDNSQWAGTTATGLHVTVRIWETPA